MPGMRYVRRAGEDPAFLLKALGEVSGELSGALSSVRWRDLCTPLEYPDDGWCLVGIAAHLRDVERGVARQVELIVSRREPDLGHVDFDDIPLFADIEEADIGELLEEFHYLRRHTVYQLWDIDERDWGRGGTHPYRGRITLLDIARDLYQHDLEHLWQVRRAVGSLSGAAR